MRPFDRQGNEICNGVTGCEQTLIEFFLNRMEFSEFSEIKEWDKSLKHESVSIKDLLFYQCPSDAEVECGFLTQEIAGFEHSNPSKQERGCLSVGSSKVVHSSFSEWNSIESTESIEFVE